jgi:hypothetical protein
VGHSTVIASREQWRGRRSNPRPRLQPRHRPPTSRPNREGLTTAALRA